MSHFDFTLNLPAPTEKLVNMVMDFEKLPSFSKIVKSVKIINKNNHETTTEEVLSRKITQQTITKRINSNEFESEIVSGPFKGTKAKTVFETVESGTKVSVSADLKLSLKYKILGPIIKKRYKNILRGTLYKMNTAVMNS